MASSSFLCSSAVVDDEDDDFSDDDVDSFTKEPISRRRRTPRQPGKLTHQMSEPSPPKALQGRSPSAPSLSRLKRQDSTATFVSQASIA